MEHNFLFTAITEKDYLTINHDDVVFSLRYNSLWYKKLQTEKNVQLLPHPEQIALWASKIRQAQLFNEYVVPHTKWAINIIDLLILKQYYDNHYSGELVTKPERNSGFGRDVRKWKNIDEIISFFNQYPTKFEPMIIQSFIDNYKDYRVIMLGEYIYTKQRKNSKKWRQNVHLGADITATTLTKKEYEFCKKILQISNLPFIYIDLMITPDHIYLGEISLTGDYNYFSNDILSQIEIQLIKDFESRHNNK